MKPLMYFALAIMAANAQTIELKVDNMGCPNCAKKIIKASEKVASVKDYKADYKSKDLVLEFDQQVSEEDIIKQINEIGYKAHK